MSTTVQTAAAPKAEERTTEVSDIEWADAPRIAASGVCMGTADLVPGVSGGTMAVALGIYREFLAAITSLNIESLRALVSLRWRSALAIIHWRFIAALGFGIVVALVVMGKLLKLPQMVSTNPKPVYAVFFGLVLASVFILAKRIRSWSPTTAVALPIGAAIGFIVVTLVPVQTPESPLFIFLCGVIAISAMVLPGISGSFILLILGKYEYIITSVLELKASVALPFVLGCALGITLFSRLLGWLLDRFHDAMIAGLTGLLVGSLIRIWPYQHVKTELIREKLRVISAEAYWPASFELSVAALIVAGVAVVLAVEFLASRRRGV